MVADKKSETPRILGNMIKEETKKELKQKVKALEKKATELEANWKRALADYQNLEKRVTEERLLQAKLAGKDFFTKLLPVFDSLTEAAKHSKNEGLNSVLKQLNEVLRDLGIERIETKGQPFDPTKMEVIDVVKSDKEGMVVEEKRAGYLLKGELLRVAAVVVGKKKIDEKAEKQAKKEAQKGNYM